MPTRSARTAWRTSTSNCRRWNLCPPAAFGVLARGGASRQHFLKSAPMPQRPYAIDQLISAKSRKKHTRSGGVRDCRGL